MAGTLQRSSKPLFFFFFSDSPRRFRFFCSFRVWQLDGLYDSPGLALHSECYLSSRLIAYLILIDEATDYQ